MAARDNVMNLDINTVREPFMTRPSHSSSAIGPLRVLVSATLAAVAALHLAWGRGSPFPFATVDDRNDAVVGRPVTPSPASCHLVALVLAGQATAVLRAASPERRVARALCKGAAGALAVRAGFGFAGHTDALVPGSNSPRFRRLDRRVYSPLCALLAAGTFLSARRC